MAESIDVPRVRIRRRPSPAQDGTVTVTALGDLMLAGEWDAAAAAGTLHGGLRELADLCRADLVFANLEATAPGDGETIAKEPRLIGHRATLESALACLRPDLVSLANNHTFDACLGGFREVRELLDAAGIGFLGAGEDLASASKPSVVERGGLRFGWLAYNHDETRPSHVAGAAGFGVNPLDQDRALREVASLRREVDHVLVSLHWGVEYCHLPAPDSIRLGRRLIDAGAGLVIGHHAHVIQGVEAYGGGVVAYNLGNALTTDLEVGGRLAIHQSAGTRSSFALRAAFDSRRLVSVELVPFFAGRGRVVLEHKAPRRILERANRGLAAGVSDSRWKRRRLLEDVVLRTAKKLHPRVIRSVRPRHFVKFFKNLLGAASGRGPAA